MSSATSADRLADYLAGRITAEQLVAAVTADYYKGDGRREKLRPVMDVIERAHPGIVELSASAEKPGFAVRLAERPFPKQWEPALRQAAATISDTASTISLLPSPVSNNSPLPSPGFFRRVIQAIRKIFSA
jgi:hypothetical protein